MGKSQRNQNLKYWGWEESTGGSGSGSDDVNQKPMKKKTFQEEIY